MKIEGKPKLGILARDTGWHCSDLIRAAKSWFLIQTFNYQSLEAFISSGCNHVNAYNEHLSELDFLVVRAMPPGSLQQVVFRMDALLQLEQDGVAVVNSPKTIEASVDKYLSLALLKRAGLPVPPTAVAQTVEQALQHFEELGGDTVIKPLFGSQGLGLKRLMSTDDARTFFEETIAREDVVYQQSFVRHPGWDLRLLVIGEAVLGMKRKNEHWITNLSNGGQAIPWDPNELESELALRAADAVYGSVIGVDLVYDPEGQPKILEVNSCPGWRGLSRCLSVDVAKMVVDMLLKLRSEGRDRLGSFRRGANLS